MTLVCQKPLFVRSRWDRFHLEEGYERCFQSTRRETCPFDRSCSCPLHPERMHERDTAQWFLQRLRSNLLRLTHPAADLDPLADKKCPRAPEMCVAENLLREQGRDPAPVPYAPEKLECVCHVVSRLDDLIETRASFRSVRRPGPIASRTALTSDLVSPETTANRASVVGRRCSIKRDSSDWM